MVVGFAGGGTPGHLFMGGGVLKKKKIIIIIIIKSSYDLGKSICILTAL